MFSRTNCGGLSLTRSHPRLRENALWEKVKDFALKNGPRVEIRESLAHCICSQWCGQPGWQGSGSFDNYRLPLVQLCTPVRIYMMYIVTVTFPLFKILFRHPPRRLPARAPSPSRCCTVWRLCATLYVILPPSRSCGPTRG